MGRPVGAHQRRDEGVQILAVAVAVAVVSHHRVVDIAGQQLVVLVSREKFYARVVAPGSLGRHHFLLNGPATWSARSRRGSKSKFKAFKAAIMPSRAARSIATAGFAFQPPYLSRVTMPCWRMTACASRNRSRHSAAVVTSARPAPSPIRYCRTTSAQS